jgi:tRNA 5-methylaminomethyl-2-thiouridine biosynthesis bifunctional protein
MYEPLAPATLAFSENGIPFSADYDDIYHSDGGGPGQSRHVFLAGNRLPERWRNRDSFVILETGFGTGLNFLATWQAWLNDPQACRRLHYLSVEKHPFRAEDLAVIHAAWPEFADLAGQLRAAWPTLTPGYHRIEFAGGRLILTLLLGDATRMLDTLQAQVDAVYLDGFAPGKNPDIWSPAVLNRIGQLAGTGATLATWSVSAPVRSALQAAGFTLEITPGFASKRDMLTGLLDQVRPRPNRPSSRKAIVIGAGVAGCTCCERLASRGWDITLIDRREGPGMEASGNLAGLLMPLVSKDDNIASRLSRTALLYGLRHWQKPAAAEAGARLGGNGVFQIARNPEQEEVQRTLIDRLKLPPEFMTYLDRQQAEAHLGHAVPAGGWLFRHAGWANPPSLCQASLKLAGDRLHTHFGCSIASLIHTDGQWQALDDSGQLIAEAPVVVLASGSDAANIAQAAPLPIQRIRGQVTLIPEDLIPALSIGLCREGYAAPAMDGLHAVGASYDFDADPDPRDESTQGNLDRLANLLPGIEIELSRFANRVGFRPAPIDRMPIMGALPDWSRMPKTTEVELQDLPRHAGLYGLLGYSSRGLVWAQLLAEALVCELEGEPMPMESDLLTAIDPGRFMLRTIRREGRTK